MEDIQRLKLQSVAAMANQEVVQQQLNIHRFLRGGEEKPEHVISGEDHGCIPGDGANLASMIS